MMDTWFCAMIYFMLVYIVMWFYKHDGLSIYVNKWRMLSIGMVLYVILVVFGKMETPMPVPVADLCVRYLSDYKSLPNVVISFCIFYFIQHIDIGRIKTVNLLASVSFGVYVIHQVPDFHDFLWFKILKIDSWSNSQLWDVFFCFNVIMLYLICGLFEFFRLKLVEKRFLRTRFIQKMISMLDGKWSDYSNEMMVERDK